MIKYTQNKILKTVYCILLLTAWECVTVIFAAIFAIICGLPQIVFENVFIPIFGSLFYYLYTEWVRG